MDVFRSSPACCMHSGSICRIRHVEYLLFSHLLFTVGELSSKWGICEGTVRLCEFPVSCKDMLRSLALFGIFACHIFV